MATALSARALAAPDSTVVAEAVRGLDSDHDRATAAVYVLQAGGAVAAEQIRDAWPALSLLGQTRALRALTRLAEKHEAALQVLLVAARSDDESLREHALAALGRITPRGRAGLVTLLPDPLVGDRAAEVLASREPRFAIRPLLDAMADRGGSDRLGLRRALGIAVRLGGAEADRDLQAWLEGRPDPEVVAAAALGLRGLEAHRTLLTSLITYAAPRSTGFSTQWRLLQSAGLAGASQTVDRWVVEKLERSPEWMLRQSAVDAITARGHREEARGSLADPYPRVRARAAEALSGDPASLLLRAALARRDTWPMVRAAAVFSLRSEAAAMPVIVASVDDSMSLVRAAAIDVLADASGPDGWDRIHRRLRDPNEWPTVTAAAIEYVVAHCRTDAVDSLLRVVMRAAPSHALTEDLNNAALAIGALRALGSPESRSAIELLHRTDGVPPTLKMALEQPLAEDANCDPKRR
jgi:hypothetical protein